MSYSNLMLSGVRAHRVSVVEPKTQVRTWLRSTAISNQFYWTGSPVTGSRRPYIDCTAH